MTQHLSIRIPWKDNGYNGVVCEKPCYNNSCLRLKNIAENRNDVREAELAGCPMCGHEAELPCISEAGAFMSPETYKRVTKHPYNRNNSGSHGHFRETELIYPPFSLPARPFGWTMRFKGDVENITPLAKMHGIAYDPGREPDLGFKSNWVQDAANQRAIFDRFYSDVNPSQSLVVVYAKQVPFIEDANRVVMGLGFVKRLTPPPEHNHTDEGELRSILWETMVEHSIRDDRKDGFLFPYREMMDYAEKHPDFDLRSVTVLAEDEFFEEFSYATEHLSCDAVISILLQTIKVLDVIKQCIPGNWDECIAWTNARLAEVWKERGAFPGTGMMLCSMGFEKGIQIAEEVRKQTGEDESFIAHLERAIFESGKHLSPQVATSIGKTEQKAFLALSKERNALFWLLSRFSLTLEQAFALFNRQYCYYDKNGQLKIRKKSVEIECDDAQILENPYVIYEKTRLLKMEIQVSLRCVDMAVFPPKELQNNDPLPEPSSIPAANDERRIRAIAVSVLERQADNGHTVYPQSRLIGEMNGLTLDPYCTVTGDILNSLVDSFKPEIVPIETKSDERAWQLIRLKEFDDLIRKSVQKRVDTKKRHSVTENWFKAVCEAFDRTKPLASITNENERARETKAREEKAAVLKELAEARLSVLAGGAGTGKTTLLAILCKTPQIRNGGVLLLAPTGKARVRMGLAMQQQGVKFDAKTVAQFLLLNKRFDPVTARYRLSTTDAVDVPDTVIIDESSMLTEEMFEALMQALKTAQRIIFVGDPRQLPPIGAGRPFVDLVNHLRKDIDAFPRVGKSYGELTVTRRQQNEDGTERFDSMLAEWYSDADHELDDYIFSMLQSNQCGRNISFKTWSTPEELEQLVLETVAEETGMEGIDDVDGFDYSLGGTTNDGWMNLERVSTRRG